MSEQPSPEPLRIDIPNVDIFEFTSPDDLIKWNREEYDAWQWVGTARPFTQEICQAHERFFNSINSQANEWKQYLNSQDSPQYLQNARQAIVSTFTSHFSQPLILWRVAPAAEFLKQIREKR
jgi:hypothetical protein